MDGSTRRFFLIGSMGALLAACADNRVGVRPTPAFYRDLTLPGAAVDEAMAAAMISDYRRNAGLGPVVVDQRLSAVARDMARVMADADSVQVSLRQAPLTQRIAGRGFRSSNAAENVSAGYRTLAEAFSGWRESRTHDRVLRLARANHLGIATVHNPASRFRVYWALVMAEHQA